MGYEPIALPLSYAAKLVDTNTTRMSYFFLADTTSVLYYSLIETNNGRHMSYSEFRRWLAKQGATFEAHKAGSSHYRVTLNGKTTIFPDHGAKEMGKGLVEAIKKQLGLK